MKIKNPKLAVTNPNIATLYNIYYLDSNIIHFKYDKTVESVEMVVTKNAAYEHPFCFDLGAGSFEISNAVNCELVLDGYNYVVAIIDPTKDASCTIHESIG